MSNKAVFFRLEPEAREYIETNELLKNAGIETAFVDEPFDAAHVPADKDFDIAGVFVDSTMDKAALDALPDLKCIATMSTGFDHIDLGACRARGIVVSSVPSYGENTVAEYAFGLILNLSRKICRAAGRVRDSGTFGLEGLRGFDLKGKVLGVVGTGRIGRNVIRIAKGFGMNVVAFDAFPNEAYASEMGFEYRTLAELLAVSDIVTLHVPYMKETRHLINADTIKLMKPGAYLVNTARGGVVETDALVRALREKKLAGAALDVLEEEGAVKDEEDLLVEGHPDAHDLKTVLEDHVLTTMPNVIVTPHNAFNSREAMRRIIDTTIGNIVAYAGGKPSNIVK